MVPNRLKVQTAVSVQLQRSLHGHSLGIGAFSSETISNFLKKNKKMIYLLTTNAHLALALRWVHDVMVKKGRVGRKTQIVTSSLFYLFFFL